MLHRARGVKILGSVFIGDGVYLENEYPSAIEIHDGVEISIRAIIIAHTRGPGRIVIEAEAFIGPNTVIACSAGRVLTIGKGAVIGPGCVITKSVPPYTYLASDPPRAIARVGIPLPRAKSIEEFRSGLKPVSKAPQDSSAIGRDSTQASVPN